ncbi:claudin-34 isoform X1 [Larimichthys crocea]|uniref:claudin-34 isoform X1 n=1 Tax=Larimichthys crocea TaxID=215358 RepID=UPI00054B2C53|nr:claudin-34 isoform X1 [Larimichthys crocea]
MAYLTHTAHAQLCALWLSCLGWTLTAVALGLIQWRVWLVFDTEVISSGVAWVGIWRTCFNSHTVVTPGFRIMHCKYISLTEAFTPPEIVAGQVLMLLSLLVGLCGNAGGVYALRNVTFGMKNSRIRLAFLTSGMLCLLAAAMSLIPLVWNLNSVVTNQTIKFPPEFKMPRAPDAQHVGSGIAVGMIGAILMIVSGITFCMHRLPARSVREEVHLDSPGTSNQGALTSSRGVENLAFESHL